MSCVGCVARQCWGQAYQCGWEWARQLLCRLCNLAALATAPAATPRRNAASPAGCACHPGTPPTLVAPTVSLPPPPTRCVHMLLQGVVRGPHSIAQFRKWLNTMSQRPELRE